MYKTFLSLRVRITDPAEREIDLYADRCYTSADGRPPGAC